MPACRQCGAWIEWACHPNGESLPVEKQLGGNLVVTRTDAAGRMHVRHVKPGTGTHATHTDNEPKGRIRS